jgi:replicative DNA helicase
MRSGQLGDDDWARLAQQMTGLAKAPLFIDDSPNLTMMEIRAKARRMKQKHGLSLIVVDYLQLANADKKQDRRDLDIGEVTRGVKGLAKELDLPVLAAAQLNRGLEGRADKRPVLSDLRESGSIENDADSVLFIHREEASVELIIAKHRNGPVGKVSAYFKEEPMQFVSATSRVQDFRERKDLD